MYESDSQIAVSDAIIDQRADSLTVGITDNERAVIVEVNGKNAAFTADEARELAKAIDTTSHQRWTERADAAVKYIRDLAAVVDGDKVADEVEDAWQDKNLNP
jgi:hypothetical protein